MASPLCQVKFGAGAYASTTNGINATAGSVVVINLISSIGAPTWAIACVYADDLSTVASVNASLTIDPVGRTATFTAPVAGRGYIFQSTINAGNNLATNQPDPTTATTFGIWVPTASGARVLIPNETFESSSTSGWVADINTQIRTPAGSTTVSAGDGIRVTGTLSSPVVQGVKGTCSLEQFGAVGDGVTSDQAAMTAAIAALLAGTYGTLVLGSNRTYLVTGPFTSPAGTTIRGHGPNSIVKTATNGEVFVVGGEDVLFEDFQILGSGAGASQNGIRIGVAATTVSGFAKVRVRGVRFTNLGNDGFSYYQNPFSPYMGPVVTDCVAKSCGTGFRMGTRGEYVSFMNCKAESCTLGVYVGAGNVSWIGGGITANTTNVQLATGANDAHGFFSSCPINHPTGTNNILVGAITQGHWFVACTIYQGALSVSSASGLRFEGCMIDLDSLSTDVGIVDMANCTFPAAYANTITETTSGEFRFPGARALSGALPTLIGRRQTGAFCSGNKLFFGTDPGYTSANQADEARLYVKSGGFGYFGTSNNAEAYWTTGQFLFVNNTTFGAASGSYGTGAGVSFFANAATAPTTNPTGGGIQYAQGGAGKWRGSSGTVTTFGPAEPHCPRCGTDVGISHSENDLFGEELLHCLACELKTGDGGVVHIADFFERRKAS